MKIGYLDGFRLKQAIIAGSHVIDKMQKNLNKINVFPVPDGDTGTNMASTMNCVSEGLSECSHRSIADVSLTMAESALTGAQGNSGAILAQFFNGFAEAVKGKLQVSTTAFAEAAKQAKNAAFEAISDPKEGTILTVIKDWASHLEEMCRKTTDFVDLLHSSLQTAKKSLAETPQKLKILAKAGVVDAGAQGFVHLLEGISHFIEKGKLANNFKINAKAITPPKKIITKIKFQYCAECMVTSEKLNRTQLKQQLHDLGDSLIIANKDNRFRIHIHTNQPQQVFQILKQFGTVEDQKLDDMAKQIEEPIDIAIITDSSCDLPFKFLKANNIYIVPTKISFGPKSYLDKIELAPKKFYDKLKRSKYHPTTSQPSLASFKEIYDDVVKNYKFAISIHLPRVVSGTLQAAEKAAELFGQNKITCVDGKNVSVALGLVVMEAISALKKGDNINQIIDKIKAATNNVYLFASISTIDYMVKGGRISKPKWFLAKLLNLKPIISFDKTGKAKVVGKAVGYKAAMKKTLKLVTKRAKSFPKAKFMVAHANAYREAEWYAEQIKGIFNVQEIPIVDAAPVLGVHAGPGTAAVAFINSSE